MLWTLFHRIGMRLRLTARARLAQSIATSTQMETALAYEGAVHMQITDWLPELCAGEPPRSVASNAEFHVVLVTRGNERLQGFCGRYDRTANAWCDESGKLLAPRGDDDRWVLAVDHNAAFARAGRRAQARKDAEVATRGPLSLMWRYGFRGIAAKNETRSVAGHIQGR